MANITTYYLKRSAFYQSLVKKIRCIKTREVFPVRNDSEYNFSDTYEYLPEHYTLCLVVEIENGDDLKFKNLKVIIKEFGLDHRKFKELFPERIIHNNGWYVQYDTLEEVTRAKQKLLNFICEKIKVNQQ